MYQRVIIWIQSHDNELNQDLLCVCELSPVDSLFSIIILLLYMFSNNNGHPHHNLLLQLNFTLQTTTCSTRRPKSSGGVKIYAITVQVGKLAPSWLKVLRFTASKSVTHVGAPANIKNSENSHGRNSTNACWYHG